MKKTVSAVITAAGSGTRMGKRKMLANIKGKPLLYYTLLQFKQAKGIDEIVITAKKEDMKEYKRIIRSLHIQAHIVLGGSERIISLYNGITASKGDYILTHDGCRPFTPVWLIEKLIQETKKHNAAMTAIHPTATVKYSTDGYIQKSLPRKTTWIAQTPQGFKRNIIIRALDDAIKNKYFIPTDDSELVSRIGVKVMIIPGHEMNIKITYPVDLEIAQKLIKFI